MPRNKEYRRHEVVDVATYVFWDRGYAGTSVENLVEATGLHRRSMYGEFGDKAGLFLACIDHYGNTTWKNLISMLLVLPGGLKNIGVFFRDRVDYAVPETCRGCLFVNTIIEKSSVSSNALEKVCGYFDLLEEAFFSCLVAAQASGHIPAHKNCRILAKYLTHFFEGLMVEGKANRDRDSLAFAAQIAIESIIA
tara:strand:- start:1397 stop:1978 length:582 start_codon:yes stop_codon:yes gene_type:complete